MAHGKHAARDLRYGRRGGGWQESVAGEALAAIDAERRRAGDAWPDTSPPTRAAPATADEWRGLARMAHAREGAGQPLTSTDHDAIARHPDPPALLEVPRA